VVGALSSAAPPSAPNDSPPLKRPHEPAQLLDAPDASLVQVSSIRAGVLAPREKPRNKRSSAGHPKLAAFPLLRNAEVLHGAAVANANAQDDEQVSIAVSGGAAPPQVKRE